MIYPVPFSMPAIRRMIHIQTYVGAGPSALHNHPSTSKKPAVYRATSAIRKGVWQGVRVRSLKIIVKSESDSAPDAIVSAVIPPAHLPVEILQRFIPEVRRAVLVKKILMKTPVVYCNIVRIWRSYVPCLGAISAELKGHVNNTSAATLRYLRTKRIQQ